MAKKETPTIIKTARYRITINPKENMIKIIDSCKYKVTDYWNISKKDIAQILEKMNFSTKEGMDNLINKIENLNNDKETIERGN